MLNEKEKYRYSRQLKLQGFGEVAQENLKRSKVLVVGAGGLGCPVIQYLAAAGIGKLIVIDHDTVNETNLPRQILFGQKDIGQNKAIAAAEKIQIINSFVEVLTLPKKLENTNAFEIIRDVDLVVDCTDNFSVRYLINDVCVALDKPFVFASIYKTEGSISVFNYKGGPTYRCLYPTAPQLVPSCEMVGVINTLCGIIGTKQANEALKICSGFGEVLSGKIQFYNSLNNDTFYFSLQRNRNIQIFSQSEIESFDYPQFCGEKDTFVITANEFLNWIEARKEFQILDIRQEWEEPELTFENVIRAPLQNIENIVDRLSTETPVVVVCRFGSRSGMAADYLRIKHLMMNVSHLKGGLEELGLR